MGEEKMIRLWAYEDAPKDLQELGESPNCVSIVVVPLNGKDDFENGVFYDALCSGYIPPERRRMGEYYIYHIYL